MRSRKYDKVPHLPHSLQSNKKKVEYYIIYWYKDIFFAIKFTKYKNASNKLWL